MEAQPDMATAGVVGWPVEHSLSPKLHGYWLRELGISGQYNAFAVPPDELPEFIASVRKNPLMRGFNLTIPHKEAVIPLLDEVDDVARIIGAVNTVVVRAGKLCGTNTDAYGFSENIRPHIAQKNKAIILGAGGAARAVGKALIDLGYKHIVITNRTQEKAEAVSKQLDGMLVVEDWKVRSTLLEGADILVNTTSLGLKGQPTLELDMSALPKTALVTDIVYSPLQTPLLEAADARGNPTLDGLGMLLYQAVPGFEAWFGKRPQVSESLRRHVLGGSTC